ncbi:hypothetical protein CR513_16792, partial [Mucuna pruriens]
IFQKYLMSSKHKVAILCKPYLELQIFKLDNLGIPRKLRQSSTTSLLLVHLVRAFSIYCLYTTLIGLSLVSSGPNYGALKYIETELLALDGNQTYNIVSCPPFIKPLGSKFVFFINLHSDGLIDRYMTQLVVLGNKKEYGLDYDETFALFAKMTTVRTILALAA